MDDAMDRTPELKAAMIRAARRADTVRIQSGDGGNLSVRVPARGTFLIKASGCSFAEMCEEDIVEVDADGHPVGSGDRRPSREIASHLAIYRVRSDVGAVFHSHSPWSTAASILFGVLPSVSLPLEMKVGRVPVLEAGENHADAHVAAAVGELLKKMPDIRAFLQRKHGLFCLNSDIERAGYDAELVEEASQIAILVGFRGDGTDPAGPLVTNR